MASILSPLSFTGLKQRWLVKRKPKVVSNKLVVRASGRHPRIDVGAVSYKTEGPITKVVGKELCDHAISVLRATDPKDFVSVDDTDEGDIRKLIFGLNGETLPADSDEPPFPYLLRRGDEWAVGYRYDSDVINGSLFREDGSEPELQQMFGEGGKAADRYFRYILGYQKSDGFTSKDETLHQMLRDTLMQSALEVFGVEDVDEASRHTSVYSIYANVLLPGHVINLHLDVPEFRGLDRSNCPTWLLVVARCAGLFEDYRVNNVTSVFYPKGANGGALAVYPHIDGEQENEAARVYSVEGGSVVLLDADSHHHHSEAARALDDAGLTVECPTLPASAELSSRAVGNGDVEWVVSDSSTGEEVFVYPETDLRFSISCKFHIFQSEDEVQNFKNGEKLTANQIISTLVGDLQKRGVLDASRDPSSFALTELAPVFVEEYVTPTAPSSDSVNQLWKSYLSDVGRVEAQESEPVALANASSNPTTTLISFESGKAYSYHNLWLRDACKCNECCNVGMRPAPMSAHILALEEVAPEEMDISDGKLKVEWTDGHKSTYPMPWLEEMGRTVGRPENNLSVPVPRSTEQIVWDSSLEIPKYQLADLRSSPEEYAKFLAGITYPGVAIVKGVPMDPEKKHHTFVNVMQELIGRLNSHPIRDNRHWTISTQVKQYEEIFTGKGKSSLDYAAKDPLLSHSDHSDYLTPAFMVCMHVLDGRSCNSVVDAFAVAKALKEEDPEAYELLTTEKQGYARLQEFYEMPLNKWACSPVISLDENGNPKMIRMSEGKRTSFMTDFDKFPKYWAAYNKFTKLLDDPRFQIIFEMEQGDVLILNNHRTCHGRVYIPGGYRILLGGTFGKDQYINRVRGQKIGLHDDHDKAYMVELPMNYFDDYMETWS